MSERTRRNCHKAKCIYILNRYKEQYKYQVNSTGEPLAPEDRVCWSYISSTIDGIIDELRQPNDLTAEQIVSNYINKMNRYIFKNKELSYMYSVAYDTAQDAYDQCFLNPYF
jgi:hypothetical protein